MLRPHPRRGLRLRRRHHYDAKPGDIREQVRERYAAAAVQVTTTDPGAGCCAPSETFDGGSDVFGAALYALGDREQLPDTAKLASLGCGNPTAVAELHEGETVLDLGSGGGIDVPALRQARRPDRQSARLGHDRRDACPRPRERAEGRCRERRVSQGLHRGDTAPRRERRRGDLKLCHQPLRG